MYKQIAQNKRRTVVIMMVFVAIIIAVGAAVAYFVNDWYVLLWVSIAAIIYAVIQYFIAYTSFKAL